MSEHLDIKKTLDFLKETLRFPENVQHRVYGNGQFLQADFSRKKFKEAKDRFKDTYNRENESSKTKEVVSTIDGKIKALLFAVPAYHKNETYYIAPIRDLVAKLDDDVEIIIYSEISASDAPDGYQHVQEDFIKLIKENNKKNFYFIKSKHSSFSHWIRDPFLPAIDIKADHVTEVDCIEPFSFSRIGLLENTRYTQLEKQDKDVVESMADIQTRVPFKFIDRDSNLIFHGGNVLVGDQFILVGKDYFDLSKETFNQMLSPQRDNQTIKKYFQEWLSPIEKKEIILVGSRKRTLDGFIKDEKEPVNLDPNRYNDIADYFSFIPLGKRQPLFHLDMFLTLIGRNTTDDFYHLAMPHFENASDLPTTPMLKKHLFDRLNNWIKKIASDLESPKISQKGLKFKVHYLPTPMTYFKDSTFSRVWFCMSYNNCLLEATPYGKRAWIPNYRLNVSDDTNKTLYGNDKLLQKYNEGAANFFKTLGVNPIQLEHNYLPYMLLAGSVHCATSYIKRDVINTVI